jgi:uncharacterized delta-60 repeat protein
VFVQRDQKILVLGGIYLDSVGDNGGLLGLQSCTLIRLNADGSVDPSYACNSSFAIGPNGLNYFAMVEQADGKLVYVGSYMAFDSAGHLLSNRRGIYRLNSNGTLDVSFHSPYDEDSTTGQTNLMALTQDSQGRLLIVGNSIVNGNTTTPIFKRLLSSGDVDTTFHGATTIQTGESILIQNDGKLLLGGTNIPSNNHVVERFNADGSPDTAFNNNSLAANFSHMAQRMALQNDGKIIVMGMTYVLTPPAGQPLGITRLNSNGTRDLAFDQAAGAGFDGSQMYFPSIIVNANGNIFLGGSFTHFNNIDAHNIVLVNQRGEVLP